MYLQFVTFEDGCLISDQQIKIEVFNLFGLTNVTHLLLKLVIVRHRQNRFLHLIQDGFQFLVDSIFQLLRVFMEPNIKYMQYLKNMIILSSTFNLEDFLNFYILLVNSLANPLILNFSSYLESRSKLYWSSTLMIKYAGRLSVLYFSVITTCLKWNVISSLKSSNSFLTLVAFLVTFFSPAIYFCSSSQIIYYFFSL